MHQDRPYNLSTTLSSIGRCPTGGKYLPGRVSRQEYLTQFLSYGCWILSSCYTVLNIFNPDYSHHRWIGDECLTRGLQFSKIKVARKAKFSGGHLGYSGAAEARLWKPLAYSAVRSSSLCEWCQDSLTYRLQLHLCKASRKAHRLCKSFKVSRRADILTPALHLSPRMWTEVWLVSCSLPGFRPSATRFTPIEPQPLRQHYSYIRCYLQQYLKEYRTPPSTRDASKSLKKGGVKVPGPTASQRRLPQTC